MSVRPAGGHLIVERGGRTLWSTQHPPMLLAYEERLSIPFTLNFPTFARDIAYGYYRLTVENDFPPPATVTHDFALSFVKFLPQEHALADQVIGQVPSGVNFLDVRAIFSWPDRPSDFMGFPVPHMVELGVQQHLQGGSALLEYCPGYRRMMHVGIDGTDIVLSAKQSTPNVTVDKPWTTNTSAWPGWTYDVGPEGAFAYCIGGTRTSSGSARRGDQPHLLEDPSDFSSTWSGTLIITPGRHNNTGV